MWSGLSSRARRRQRPLHYGHALRNASSDELHISCAAFATASANHSYADYETAASQPIRQLRGMRTPSW